MIKRFRLTEEEEKKITNRLSPIGGRFKRLIYREGKGNTNRLRIIQRHV